MVRCFSLGQGSPFEEQLISIWQESFGDSRAYISSFLHANATYLKVVAYMENEKIASAVYLLPISYIGQDKKTIKCYYAYAGATLKAYRGRGCFARIWQFVNEHISEPVIFVPASESLVGYYKRQGFDVWLTEKRIEADLPCGDEDDAQHDTEQKNSSINVTQLNAKSYCTFRNRMLQKPGSMIWDENVMSYICREHQMFGGEFMEVVIDGVSIYFMCRKEENTLHVVEMLGKEASFSQKKYVQMLMQKFSCNRASVCLQPCVMSNSPLFRAEEGYFNLTMG